MASISPSLIIKSIKISGTTIGSTVRLTVQSLPELFVGVISLSKGPSAADTAGAFNKGTSKIPGTASATISGELYDFIVAQSALGAKMAIELEYTTKGAVNEVYIEFV